MLNRDYFNAIREQLFETEITSKYEIVFSCLRDMEHNTRYHVEIAQENIRTVILGKYTEDIKKDSSILLRGGSSKRTIYNQKNTNDPAVKIRVGDPDDKGLDILKSKNISFIVTGDKYVEESNTFTFQGQKSVVHFKPSVMSIASTYLSMQLFAKSKTVMGMRWEASPILVRSSGRYMMDGWRIFTEIVTTKIERYQFVSRKVDPTTTKQISRKMMNFTKGTKIVVTTPRSTITA